MSISRYTADDYMVTAPDGEFVLFKDYAALEDRCAGLERERDDFHDTLMRMSAYIGHDMSDGVDHSGLLDDVIRLDKERDALQAKIDSARTGIDKICAEYRQRTNELDHLQVQHKRALGEREELKAKLAAAEEAMTHCVEYWNRSETDGAMSDALHEIVGTLTATLPVPAEVEVVAKVEGE